MKRKSSTVFMLQLVKKINSSTNCKNIRRRWSNEYTTVVSATALDSAPLQFLHTQVVRLVNTLEIMKMH